MFSSVEAIKARFKVEEVIKNPRPRYNIAPSQKIPVIVQRENRQLTEMRWGLIPFWAEDTKIGYHTINARAETIAKKPAFRNAFRKRRCLVVADNFFEWQKVNGEKIPRLIRMKSERLFAMAGLYEYWERKSGKVVESCTIVTTEANDFIRPIHDRMPVILRPENEEAWLNPDLQEVESIKHLLDPVSADLMEEYEISTYVNDPKHTGKQIIQRNI